jgi:hypothetical protein
MGYGPEDEDEDEDEGARGASSGSKDESFPDEPRVSLDDPNYADVVLQHAVREAINVAALAPDSDSDAPEKEKPWALRSAPHALATVRRQGSLLRSYFNLIHDNLSYLAAWPIGAAIKPGDVGLLAGGAFIALTNLNNLGVNHRTSKFPLGEEAITISTRGTTRLTVEPIGAPTGDVDSAPATSRIEIRMRGREGEASLAHWQATERIVIDNMENVKESVLELVKNNRWPQDCVLITETQRARNGLILIAKDRESSVTCRINRAGRDVLSDPISSLDDPSLEISRTSGVAFHVVLKDEFTACMRASRIKRSFLGPDSSLTPVDRWE